MIQERTTLTQYIIEEQRRAPGATGDFSMLLSDIVTACKAISHEISRGGLDVDGGHPQALLERFADDTIAHATWWTGRLAGIASEIRDDIVRIPDRYPVGKYLLTLDPLNGAGNLDINFMSGTIFSIYRAPRATRAIGPTDFLQPGKQIVAAGFVLYGASTRLVLSLGKGVSGFMLDREIGEFVLTQRRMEVPDDAATFAINASNERFWEAPVRRYVNECLAGRDGPRLRDFGMRWASSLIAEAYRVLLRGGVFLYPMDDKTREQGGRLSLLNAANPIAFLMEQAGGGATTGRSRILDVVPTELNQHAPFIFGSRGEVERIHRYHLDYLEGRDQDNYDLPLFGNRSLFLQSELQRLDRTGKIQWPRKGNEP